MPLFQSICDIDSSQGILRCRRYGTIEVAAGELKRIQFRPWPKIASIVEARWISRWRIRHNAPDICRLYFNQPLLHQNYLALSYIESTRHTRWRSIFRSLQVLDQIASIKRSDAILAQISNHQISDRLMERLGWQRHLEHQRHRHWIKRFYGDYAPKNHCR